MNNFKCSYEKKITTEFPSHFRIKWDKYCLYLYLYEVLGPGRDDMSGQWSVWCSHLLQKNYAVGL